MASSVTVFSPWGRGLAPLKWGSPLPAGAAMKTGLKDPLARFNRHELERFFERFKTALDAHLKRLVYELKKEDPAGLAAVVASATPDAKQALRRADASR